MYCLHEYDPCDEEGTVKMLARNDPYHKPVYMCQECSLDAENMGYRVFEPDDE